MANEASLLVVVRGESCTGKTRTAVEALTAAVPDDFQLLFPTDADSLLAALAADVLSPRSVLWLNEAQDYLDGPVGEAAAAALLRRTLQGQVLQPPLEPKVVGWGQDSSVKPTGRLVRTSTIPSWTGGPAFMHVGAGDHATESPHSNWRPNGSLRKTASRACCL
ncbi:hypothetical protein OHT57_00385 [Streptomyces sp. NBC_00285]|uniref:hypothetical protein n=1 Tax=Streptomyces sp. NBC_00285 TaxID=2975700 RepID=UPI002E29355D|nr:hypothetical protein [Streptomyces sp. NBC_00285]